MALDREFGESFWEGMALAARVEQAWRELSDIQQRTVLALNDMKARAPRRYAVFILHIQGLLTEQIAEVLGISPDSVYQHLARARSDLSTTLLADDVIGPQLARFAGDLTNKSEGAD